MANRDYFKKPIQSDRNSFGYGNNKIEPMEVEPRMWQGPYWLYALTGIAFVIAAAMSA